MSGDEGEVLVHDSIAEHRKRLADERDAFEMRAEAAEAERDALLNAVQPYLQHKFKCERPRASTFVVEGRVGVKTPGDCTCGLEELRALLRGDE